MEDKFVDLIQRYEKVCIDLISIRDDVKAFNEKEMRVTFRSITILMHSRVTNAIKNLTA